jgi:hypothetical protein
MGGAWGDERFITDLVGKTEGKRQLRRPWSRRQDNIETKLR